MYISEILFVFVFYLVFVFNMFKLTLIGLKQPTLGLSIYTPFLLCIDKVTLFFSFIHMQFYSSYICVGTRMLIHPICII